MLLNTLIMLVGLSGLVSTRPVDDPYVTQNPSQDPTFSLSPSPSPTSSSLDEPSPSNFEKELNLLTKHESSLVGGECNFRNGECAPLVVDYNKDGIVSGILRSGISLNVSDWQQRSGAATNGDKMLAMCDLNKNGIIDGTEIFSHLTEFPLFPTQNKSANGFAALHRVAQALAFKYPDLSIVRWFKGKRYVLLEVLQTALKRMNCNLGFISDDNRDPAKLEAFGHVLGIDVTGFVTNSSAIMGNDGIIRYHTSTYFDSDGIIHPVAGLFFSS